MSNTLFEVDEVHYQILEGFLTGKTDTAPCNETFLNILHEKNVLVKPGEEKNLLQNCQYMRQAACFDNTHLALTICPTLSCNFRCPYCFEQSQNDRSTMNGDTTDRLITFIQSHHDAQHLDVTWYGGEPLLAFDIICELTERFKDLDLHYEKAGLVTNGYLLDENKISRLNELMIKSIQITLDGPREIHDTRRVLAGGGPTYDRILANITALLDSDYQGSFKIRVNIDRENMDHYIPLRNSLMEEFRGKKITVQTGHVQTEITSPYYNRTLNTDEFDNFNLGLFRQEGILPPGGFYPESYLGSVCLANRHMGFVVGPKGELYKCWEDPGKPEMVIGSVYNDEPVTNPVLRAQYTVGTDPFCDPECTDCEMLPICGGGCANKRLRAKEFGEEGPEYCTACKNHLNEHLEAYIRTFTTKELCKDLFDTKKEKKPDPGYRIISPQPEKRSKDV
ncbi:radical SAM/SPASM domain-containing protein [Methanoplanus endosymbiosus]|uniref:Radical SAM protein n=1 Tax=Methanoplanus endosymbiosus TaxID=33865 RepID=A0A9E7THK8_9EURY|nr:radical SAM protein [Methanoplanus endosymbiosus]UUX93147.1 radical SAM protein [Methanoplanus endosymbiosus]